MRVHPAAPGGRERPFLGLPPRAPLRTPSRPGSRPRERHQLIFIRKLLLLRQVGRACREPRARRGGTKVTRTKLKFRTPCCLARSDDSARQGLGAGRLANRRVGPAGRAGQPTWSNLPAFQKDSAADGDPPNAPSLPPRSPSAIPRQSRQSLRVPQIFRHSDQITAKTKNYH